MSTAKPEKSTGCRTDSAPPAGPVPPPLRFFGTTWLAHDRGYPLRRVAVALGSLACAAAGCLALGFGYQGLVIADGGAFLGALAVAGFAVCGVLAFRHTWRGFDTRQGPAEQGAARGFLGIGFVGVLLAYFLRSLTEAPGEALRRAEHEAALHRHERRRAGPPHDRKPGSRRR